MFVWRDDTRQREKSSLISNEESLLIDRWIYTHIEKADHHFRPGLFAPRHCGIGIGIVRIVLGVVECRDGLQRCAGLERDGLGQAITKLSVEIVVRDS